MVGNTIMAQSTPTHASGFHLVTVAKTGHAEEKGSTTATNSSLKRCCLNAVNESRSEKMGLYRDDQWGVACLRLLKIVIALHRCHRSHRRDNVY